jgi:AcrR family transcriptional regulator
VEVIIAAARECIAHDGVEGTRMEDVAARARVSRPHLYSFVSGRAGLLELVALQRLGELGAELADRARELDGDVGEAIVDQIVAATQLGRSDPEFAALAEGMTRARLNFVLTSGSSPLHAINTRVFAPLFARALAEGRLRSDTSTDEIIEWLQGVMALFVGRDDLDDAAQRRMLRTFVLPGILT